VRAEDDPTAPELEPRLRELEQGDEDTPPELLHGGGPERGADRGVPRTVGERVLTLLIDWP
jgi:hypothetical protein